jgi:hypothetical protein
LFSLQIAFHKFADPITDERLQLWASKGI